MRTIFPTILASILLAGAVAFLRIRTHNQELRTTLHATMVHQETLRAQIAAVEHDLTSLTSETAEQQRALHSARTTAARDEKALAAVDPETIWAQPPPLLPDWQPDSPYVWLSKETVARLPWEAFSRDGQLTPELAAILTLNPAEIGEVNQIARETLHAYQRMELDFIEPSTNHLPGILEADGPKFTIQVQASPEEGERLKREFEAGLASAVGKGRADFLLRQARSWIVTELSDFAAGSRTISVARTRPDYFSISVRNGDHGWLSTGGPFRHLSQYIPPHLLPYFEHLQPEDPPKMTVAPQAPEALGHLEVEAPGQN